MYLDQSNYKSIYWQKHSSSVWIFLFCESLLIYSSFLFFEHIWAGVLTRVLNAVCDAEHTMDMTVEKCWGFQVFHRIEFYAIRSESTKISDDRWRVYHFQFWSLGPWKLLISSKKCSGYKSLNEWLLFSKTLIDQISEMDTFGREIHSVRCWAVQIHTISE